MTFPATDRAALRALAARVAELAARPGEREKEILWRKHNTLTATRPLIFCDPENGWNEIVPSSVLTCENELARQWEFTLRREIFWGAEMNDDRVIRPVFDIPHVYTESDWGMHETRPIEIPEVIDKGQSFRVGDGRGFVAQIQQAGIQAIQRAAKFADERPPGKLADATWRT